MLRLFRALRCSVDQSLPTGFRCLIVVPKGQSEIEIILMKVGSGDFAKMKGGNSPESTKKDVDAIADLIQRGWFSAGAFHTADCRKPTPSTKPKGSSFSLNPKTRFMVSRPHSKILSENWFSLTQPKNYG